VKVRRGYLAFWGYVADTYDLWCISNEVCVTHEIDKKRDPRIRRGPIPVVECSGSSLGDGHQYCTSKLASMQLLMFVTHAEFETWPPLSQRAINASMAI
jgi:hypothetical protein